jgi:hypothetical protein
MAHSSDVVDDVSGDGRDDVSDEMGGDRVHRPRRDGRRQGTSAPVRWAEWMMSPAMAGMMSLARWAEAGRVGPGEMGRHVFRAGGSGDDSGETTAGRIGPGEMGRRVFRAWGGAVTTQVRSVVAGREIRGKG